MKSVIAAQMYTLRDFTKTPADIAKTCARVKKIGFDNIQVSAFGPIDIHELAKILKNEGLNCCATHTSFERMQAEPQKVIDEHLTIGCRQTAPGGLPGSYGTRGAEGYSHFAKDASTVAKQFKAAGITWSYHNHAFEFERFNGRRGMDILFEDSDPAAFNFELDTFWVQTGGGDPAAWIRHCNGRIPLLHLKDLTVRANKPIMAEVGEGNLDWTRILEAAKASGVLWYIIEQDVCERDPFDSLAISLKNLKEMGLA